MDRVQEDLGADVVPGDQRPGPSTSAANPAGTSANQSNV
jgi:hypothetical protein